jgi:hypothetical protein
MLNSTNSAKPKPLTTKQRRERLARDQQKALDLIRQNPNVPPWQIAAELEGTPVMSSQWPRHRASAWQQACYVTQQVLGQIGIFFDSHRWHGQGLGEPETGIEGTAPKGDAA